MAYTEAEAAARAIRVRLAELDMQQSDLARLLGTSEAYITYLIYGDRRDESWVARICQALGMEAERFAGDDPGQKEVALPAKV